MGLNLYVSLEPRPSPLKEGALAQVEDKLPKTVYKDTPFSTFKFPEFAIETAEVPRCAETDPEMFYPQETNKVNPDGTVRYSYRPSEERMAKAVCAGCPLRQPCLEFALMNGEVGIWGGTTEWDRRRLRRSIKGNR